MNLDIVKFLRAGSVFNFDENTLENEIISQIGIPEFVEDYDSNGRYLHYDNIRFSLNQGKLISFSIHMFNYDKSYQLDTDFGLFELDNKMNPVSLLHIINQLGIKWDIIFKDSLLDYLVFHLESEVKIYYYYENAKIERLSRSFID